MSVVFQASHHPPPNTAPLPQPDIIRQLKRAFEFEVEGQYLDALEGDPFFLDHVGDAGFEAVGDLPADTLGKSQQVGSQEPFKEGVAVAQAAHRLPLAEIIRIEGLPLMDAVSN